MSGTVIKEGYLVKSPPLTKTVAKWKRRYFKLFESGRLDYYETPRDEKAKGIVNLLDCSSIDVVGHFEGRNHCLRLVTQQRIFILQCRDTTEMRHWHGKITSTRDNAVGQRNVRGQALHTSPSDPKSLDHSPVPSPQLPHHSQDDIDLQNHMLSRRPKSMYISPSLDSLNEQGYRYQNVTAEQRDGLTPPTSHSKRSYSPQPPRPRPYKPGDSAPNLLAHATTIRPSDLRRAQASSAVSSLDFADHTGELDRPGGRRGKGRITRSATQYHPESSWDRSYHHPGTSLQSSNGYLQDDCAAGNRGTLTRTDSEGYIPMAPQAGSDGILDDYEPAAEYTPPAKPGGGGVPPIPPKIMTPEFEVPEDYQKFTPTYPDRSGPGVPPKKFSGVGPPPQPPSRQKRQTPPPVPHHSTSPVPATNKRRPTPPGGAYTPSSRQTFVYNV